MVVVDLVDILALSLLASTLGVRSHSTPHHDGSAAIRAHTAKFEQAIVPRCRFVIALVQDEAMGGPFGHINPSPEPQQVL